MVFQVPVQSSKDWLYFLHWGSSWNPWTIITNPFGLKLGTVHFCFLHPNNCEANEPGAMWIIRLYLSYVCTHWYHLCSYMMQAMCKRSKFKTVTNTKTWPLFSWLLTNKTVGKGKCSARGNHCGGSAGFGKGSSCFLETGLVNRGKDSWEGGWEVGLTSQQSVR